MRGRPLVTSMVLIVRPHANLIKTIEPLAAKNGNEVAVNCDGAIGMLNSDQMRLRLANLRAA